MTEKDRKTIMSNFVTKLHHRFNAGNLQSLFTVDGYDCDEKNEEKKTTDKVKCMPGSYPNAISAIDTIYKVFS